MRCKAIVFVLGAFISIGVMNGVNKIENLSSEIESQYTSKFKLPKKIKPKKVIKKVVKKSKKENELEYWSEVTGRKVAKVTKINARLSFYSSDPSENGGYSGIDCRGNKLKYGTIANNYYPLGTKIYIKDFGLMSVNDHGGHNFNSWNNFDVYINGSMDYVNSLGLQNKSAWILEFAE